MKFPPKIIFFAQKIKFVYFALVLIYKIEKKIQKNYIQTKLNVKKTTNMRI